MGSAWSKEGMGNVGGVGVEKAQKTSRVVLRGNGESG